MKELQTYTYSLPNNLVEDIKECFPKDSLQSSNDRTRSFHLFHTITTKSQYLNGDPDGYVTLSSNYLRKMFSGNYSRIINKLRDKGLIEGYNTDTSKDSYRTSKRTNKYTKISAQREGIAKKFRICPKYSFSFSFKQSIIDNNNSTFYSKSNNDFKLLPSFSKPLLTEVSYDYKAKSKKQADINFQKEFEEMISVIKIDYTKLYIKAYELVNNIDVDKYLVGEYEDMDKVLPITVVSWDSKVPMSIGKAIRLAQHRYESLFVIKGKYYIAGKEQFSERLKTKRMASYTSSIGRLEVNNISINRNLTNNRADSNFTNMKSDIFKEIMKQNSLIGYDLKNSQFCILANHIKNTTTLNTEDFNLFYKLATGGTLYESISKNLKISRQDTKELMFSILFNKINAKIKYKDRFEKMFPSVMEYVNKFKKIYGYDKFSVYLQKLESSMFIDNLYQLLKEQMDIVFTKHDSVIVREEDKKLAEYIINEYFKSINFKGVMLWE